MTVQSVLFRGIALLWLFQCAVCVYGMASAARNGDMVPLMIFVVAFIAGYYGAIHYGYLANQLEDSADD